MSYTSIDATPIPNGYSIVLYGEPTSWSAPTFSKTGAYDKKWKQKRDAFLLLKEKDLKTLLGPVTLDICYFIKPPKSWSRKKTQSLLGQYHTNHVDLTNLTKFLEDVLEKAGVIQDDCFVCDKYERKMWGEESKSFVSVVVNSGSPYESNCLHKEN